MNYELQQLNPYERNVTLEFLDFSASPPRYIVAACWKPDNRERWRPCHIHEYDEEDFEKDDFVVKYKKIVQNNKPRSWCCRVSGEVPGEATLAFLFALEVDPRIHQLMEDGKMEGHPRFLL